MAKGGRYLNTNKDNGQKKKGRGLKAFVTILVILALLIAGGMMAFKLFMGSMLGNVNRAEFEEKNQEKTYDDLMAEIYGNMETSGAEAAEPAASEEEDVYIPENIQQMIPTEQTSAG